MSEAPCDGTYIALNVNGQIRPARWMLPEDEVRGQWYAWLDFFGPTRIHPTAMLGWQPLPPAPEDAPRMVTPIEDEVCRQARRASATLVAKGRTEPEDP